MFLLKRKPVDVDSLLRDLRKMQSDVLSARDTLPAEAFDSIEETCWQLYVLASKTNEKQKQTTKPC